MWQTIDYLRDPLTFPSGLGPDFRTCAHPKDAHMLVTCVHISWYWLTNISCVACNTAASLAENRHFLPAFGCSRMTFSDFNEGQKCLGHAGGNLAMFPKMKAVELPIRSESLLPPEAFFANPALYWGGGILNWAAGCQFAFGLRSYRCSLCNLFIKSLFLLNVTAVLTSSCSWCFFVFVFFLAARPGRLLAVADRSHEK